MLPRLFLTSILALLSFNVSAYTYDLNENTYVVGKEDTYLLQKDGTTTMEYVASHYKLGLSNMIEANPKAGLKI